jgi:hypothetical protein
MAGCLPLGLLARLFRWRRQERDARRVTNHTDFDNAQPLEHEWEARAPININDDLQHNWITSRVTLEITAAIKLRLGLMNRTPANEMAAHREGLDYIRSHLGFGGKWKDMRIAHQQLHLVHAVNNAFLPNTEEIKADKASRSYFWRHRSNQVKRLRSSFGGGQ